MFQEEESGRFCGVLLICQNPSTVFSNVIIMLTSTAGSGQERPLERSFALPFLLPVLPLLNAQWAEGAVAHSKPLRGLCPVILSLLHRADCGGTRYWDLKERHLRCLRSCPTADFGPDVGEIRSPTTLAIHFT